MVLDTGAALSLTDAAELIGIPKPTLSRHRKQGRFSAEMINRMYFVEPVELARAYPKEWRLRQSDTSDRTPLISGETPSDAQKDSQIAALKALLEAKDAHLEDLRDQLRLVNARLNDHTPQRPGLIARIFG
jgi:hypothetical protein